MNTISDLFNQKDVWGLITSKGGFNFLEPSELMNQKTIFKYGNLPLNTTVRDNLDVEILTDILVSEFSERWLTLAEIQFDSLDLTAKELAFSKKDSNRNSNTSSNDSSENKVSGYNEDTLITETGVDNTRSGNESGESTENVNSGIRGFNFLYENLKYQQKVNILNTVIKDVVQQLTLKIY